MFMRKSTSSFSGVGFSSKRTSDPLDASTRTLQRKGGGAVEAAPSPSAGGGFDGGVPWSATHAPPAGSRYMWATRRRATS